MRLLLLTVATFALSWLRLGSAGAPVALGIGAVKALLVAGVFIETHQDPDRAPSDGPNMLPLAALPSLLSELMDIDRLAKRRATP